MQTAGMWAPASLFEPRCGGGAGGKTAAGLQEPSRLDVVPPAGLWIPAWSGFGPQAPRAIACEDANEKVCLMLAGSSCEPLIDALYTLRGCPAFLIRLPCRGLAGVKECLLARSAASAPPMACISCQAAGESAPRCPWSEAAPQAAAAGCRPEPAPVRASIFDSLSDFNLNPLGTWWQSAGSVCGAASAPGRRAGAGRQAHARRAG